jgi:hypothetical protein
MIGRPHTMVGSEPASPKILTNVPGISPRTLPALSLGAYLNFQIPSAPILQPNTRVRSTDKYVCLYGAQRDHSYMANPRSRLSSPTSQFSHKPSAPSRAMQRPEATTRCWRPRAASCLRDHREQFKRISTAHLDCRYCLLATQSWAEFPVPYPLLSLCT